MVKLRGLIYHFSKGQYIFEKRQENGFGFLGVVNDGNVNILEKVLQDKVGFCLYRLILAPSPSPVIKVAPVFLVQGREEHLHQGNL